MSGLVEAATSIMSASERRLETISNNVSNISTPGFKRQVSFSDVLAGTASGGVAGQQMRVHSDLAQGKMSSTGNPLDLAISGSGFFQLRSGEELVYSRHGQFRRAEDGTVVNQQGHRLQQVGGGDLVLENAAVEILADGTVLDAGRPVARVGVFAPAEQAQVQPLGGSMFAIAADALDEVERPELRQGMIEASNVAIGDEMVAMMAALRQAESGARLVQLYDDLIGRAITAFGQGGR
jgi:flagellar basal-body rod protein FlgG